MTMRLAGTMSNSDRAAAFYRLVWPHAAAMLRLARILTRCDADADDLCQEAMLKAYKALDSLRDEGGAKQWVLAILRHCHIDRSRVRKHEISLDGAQMEPSAASNHEEFHTTDAEELLQTFSDEQVIHALRQLPQDIRWTLLLVDVEGMPDADAAEVLSIPLGTVKSRLHRGRRMLVQALRPMAVRMRLAV
jgi:RNA polymerase sigma-70 factor (ECF subfamily)